MNIQETRVLTPADKVRVFKLEGQRLGESLNGMLHSLRIDSHNMDKSPKVGQNHKSSIKVAHKDALPIKYINKAN